MSDDLGEWHKTACSLCYVNCGLEVRTEGRAITKVRGVLSGRSEWASGERSADQPDRRRRGTGRLASVTEQERVIAERESARVRSLVSASGR